MQEKIANLEIKIFYDSAITKKKKKVENYQNPSVSREHTGLHRWHGVGQGSDSKENAPGKAPLPRSPRQQPGARSARLKCRLRRIP